MEETAANNPPLTARTKRSNDVREYLTKTIVPDLIGVLTDMSLEKPQNPSLFLAAHFFKKAGVSLQEFAKLVPEVEGLRVNESKKDEGVKVEATQVAVEKIDKEQKMQGSQKPRTIVIAGAPASGKGTQCEYLVEKFGVVHISTGDMLRAAAKSGSEMGLKAAALMEAGQLVPDELIISLVQERLGQEDCKDKGWLLDGFPRTHAQAEAMISSGIVPEIFVYLAVPDEILVERVVGRRMDPETNKIYHLKFNPPPQEEEVLARLIHRKDDNEETALNRLKQFHEHIAAVKGSFAEKVCEIDGNKDKKEVFQEIAIKVDERLNV